MNTELSIGGLDERPNWKVTLRALWIAQFVAMSGMSMVTPFLPFVIQEMGIPDGPSLRNWVGILISINFLTAAFLAPLWWHLADRYGKKLMALRAVFGLGLAVGLMSLARNPWDLLFLRILQGSLGGFIAASISLLASQTPKERLGYALGSLNAAVMAGGLLGPLVGGVLATLTGYRGLFLVVAASCVASGVLVARKVHEPSVSSELRSEGRGLRASMALLAASPELKMTFVSQFLVYTAMMMLGPILPLYVSSVLGQVSYLPTAVGLVASALGIPCVLFAASWGRLGDRLGSQLVLLICVVGLAFSVPTLLWAGSLVSLVGARLLMGVFLAGTPPAAHTLVAASLPHQRQATGLSLLSTAQLLGNTCGPLLGGSISAHAGFPVLFMGASLLLALAAIWVGFWSLRFPKALFKDKAQT